MRCFYPRTAYRSITPNFSGRYPIVFNPSGRKVGPPILIPCGKCIACHIKKSKDWAVRCYHEALLHQENAFVTLTYRTECLPDKGNLVKEHFVLFMKRLRKEVYVSSKRKIRFFHCGEYGSVCETCGLHQSKCRCKQFKYSLGRPHHHVCIFGYDFPDKELWKIRRGNPLFTSELLQRLWGYGFCITAGVTYESAAYVARYITKKSLGLEKAADHYKGRIPEYITMSNRPGIGARWIDENWKSVFPNDYVTLPGRPAKFRPPRYYEKRFALTQPKLMANIKARRKVNAERKQVNECKDAYMIRDGKTFRLKDYSNSNFSLMDEAEILQRDLSKLKRGVEDGRESSETGDE